MDEAGWTAQRRATQGRTAARGAAMRRTQSAVDAAAELVKFSTSPDLTPKRVMGYSNVSASPHRVRRIDLRDQGRGDGAAPPAAKVARLGTRPPPPPPVWERRSSSIDSVATEVVGVSPDGLEDGANHGGGVANENDETKFSPVSESASVRTRPIAPRPALRRTPSPPPAKNHVAHEKMALGRPALRRTPRRSRCRRPGRARRPHRARNRPSR